MSGYEWTITFVQDIGDIADATVQSYDLYSETGTLSLSILQDGTGDSVTGTSATDYGSSPNEQP